MVVYVFHSNLHYNSFMFLSHLRPLSTRFSICKFNLSVTYIWQCYTIMSGCSMLIIMCVLRCGLGRIRTRESCFIQKLQENKQEQWRSLMHTNLHIVNHLSHYRPVHCFGVVTFFGDVLVESFSVFTLYAQNKPTFFNFPSESRAAADTIQWYARSNLNFMCDSGASCGFCLGYTVRAPTIQHWVSEQREHMRGCNVHSKNVEMFQRQSVSRGNDALMRSTWNDRKW